MMLADPAAWHALMAALTDLTIAFLRLQVQAGVDAIQLFDSWAGTLSPADYRSHRLAAQRGCSPNWRTQKCQAHSGSERPNCSAPWPKPSAALAWSAWTGGPR